MTPINRLKQLALELNRKQYPSFPDQYRVIHKYTDTTANGLTRCVIDWITLNGGQAERITNTGRMIDNRKTYTDVVGRTKTIGSTKWIPGTGKNGTSDISATIRGRSVKIEVKIGKDRQSDDQRTYQIEVEQAGGVYLIVKNFKDFVIWYDNFVLSLK